jgi:uncharacterized phage-associated protein
LTNLKLQKFLYYAQAWYLALNGKPLFGEDLEAWVHGPVLPSQYDRFRDFHWRPITEEVKRPQIPNATIKAHLTEVVDVFGPETAVALEVMTHQERPWSEARHGLPMDVPSHEKISKDLMRDYYRSVANKQIKKTNIPQRGPHISRAMVPDELIRFSFRFFDGTDEKICPSKFQDGYTRTLIERLRDISHMTIKEFTSNKCKALRAHTHDWPKTKKPSLTY